MTKKPGVKNVSGNPIFNPNRLMPLHIISVGSNALPNDPGVDFASFNILSADEINFIYVKLREMKDG